MACLNLATFDLLSQLQESAVTEQVTVVGDQHQGESGSTEINLPFHIFRLGAGLLLLPLDGWH